MFVRISTRRQSGTIYRYGQVVRSVREPGCHPKHEVLFSLGRIETEADEARVEALRAAFRAGSKGESLVAVSALSESARPVRPAAALRYLDVAVVLETFKQLGLGEVLRSSIGPSEMEVEPEKVVASLVVQRCLAPDSKLEATRWFPTTALPELLGIAPSQFNNTRIHRTLELLEQATPGLMRTVSRGCAERTKKGFATLYMDATDTWFVGKGPDMAERGKTKEGLVRKKVGIVLLCGEYGEPLRWEVLEGRCAEPPAMLDMMGQVREIPWLRDVPVVCDRIMGHTAHLRKMMGTGLPFVTAVTSTEMQTYCPEFSELSKELQGLVVEREEQLETVAAGARDQLVKGGMTIVSETLLVLDAGQVPLPDQGQELEPQSDDRVGDALRIARQVTEQVHAGTFGSYIEAFRARGLKASVGKRYRTLMRLPADLQQRILNGEAAGHGIVAYCELMFLPNEEAIRRQFEKLLTRRRAGKSKVAAEITDEKPTKKLQIRSVVTFNPELFSGQRLSATRTLEGVANMVKKLNVQLAKPRSSMKPKGIEQRIDQELRRRDLLTAYELHIEEVEIGGKRRYQAKLELIEEEWRKRRSSDGFSVLVAHPDVTPKAEKLSAMYRAKNAVEVDFQVIKSVAELRPVRHHTDLKVRAHVTLCMLALLIERTLHKQLMSGRNKVSPARALGTLEEGRLCHYPAPKGRDTYLLTTLDAEQRRILRRLRLERLADDRAIAATLQPRSTFVTTPGA